MSLGCSGAVGFVVERWEVDCYLLEESCSVSIRCRLFSIAYIYIHIRVFEA